MPFYYPVYNIVMRFFKTQTKKVIHPVLVSQQVIWKRANSRGQYLHMDTLTQYVVAIVPLTRCRSTLMLDINYPCEKNEKYPMDWCSYPRLGDMMNPGDVMVMMANAIHAGIFIWIKFQRYCHFRSSKQFEYRSICAISGFRFWATHEATQIND